MDHGIIWQLIDTSVKVILGAIITGMLFWLLLWRRQQPVEDPAHNRKVQLLEQISADVGAVSHAFAKYSALLVESIRYGERWPSARREELAEINKELVTEFKKLAEAEATLLMLGEKGMEKTLRVYGAKIAIFRKEVYVGRQDISQEEITKFKGEINSLRENFYDLLSRKYDRLLTAH
ncbi:hypothetical protein [Halioxenophilus sp. WMMB6]|uniref:hypothetical protein n=1 Tax=Halioxenophilus sp. WMMB6 TaxID=3073815 RepID=UPI00295F1A34|nr:hypothetical protein [Halioxenophilus sp. WMMB6]